MLCDSITRSNLCQLSVLCIDNNIKAQDVGNGTNETIDLTPSSMRESLQANRVLSFLDFSVLARKQRVVDEPIGNKYLFSNESYVFLCAFTVIDLSLLDISECDYRDDDMNTLYMSLVHKSRTLRSLIWDNNLVSVQSMKRQRAVENSIGYKNMLDLVKKNQSIVDMGCMSINKEVCFETVSINRID